MVQLYEEVPQVRQTHKILVCPRSHLVAAAVEDLPPNCYIRHMVMKISLRISQQAKFGVDFQQRRESDEDSQVNWEW